MMQRLMIILTTLLIAIALSIITVPSWAIWLRPLWVPMVFCSWVLLFPEYVGIGFGFALGLFMDILMGTLMGEHALVLSLLAFISAFYYRRVLNFPAWQQTVFMTLLLFGYLLCHRLIQSYLGHSVGTVLYWLPLVTSSLLWSPMFATLRNLTHGRERRVY